MTVRFVLAALFMAFAPVLVAAEKTIAVWSDDHISSLSDEDLMRYATTAPPVPFPEEAQRKNLAGSGVYELHVGKNGQTTQVTVVKSAGNSVLDQAARSVFIKWRFKPGTFVRVRIPVSWSVNKVR